MIIPLYNCEKTIKPTLHSIQYQNMSEIEIILINDCSTDNTSKIIEKAQKYDHRIKAIKNNKNMGALYSRSIAALMTKGEYIFGLDNDDMYFYHDVFDYIAISFFYPMTLEASLLHKRERRRRRSSDLGLLSRTYCLAAVRYWGLAVAR